MKIVAIIPARMGSSRFPGKPLSRILGLSMIEHVYRRTEMSSILDSVFVATCDQEICDAVENFGGNVIMTASTHQRASDRVAEAAEDLNADIIIMVQGDEPMTTPQMIDMAVAPMLDDLQVQCVNLTAKIKTEEEYQDPNTIKVVMDLEGNALYFSREPIPTRHLLKFEDLPVYKQVCVIPFRHDMLKTYATLEPTPLEQAESIDMLRLLEHGYKVRMVETNFDIHAVDTPEDLYLVETLMQDDPLVEYYMKND